MRLAQGYASDGEDDADEQIRSGKRKRTATSSTTTGASAVANAINSSHARSLAKSGSTPETGIEEPRFRHFMPKRWDACETRGEERTQSQRRVSLSMRPPPPDETPDAFGGPIPDWARPWMDEWDKASEQEPAPNDSGVGMDVDVKMNVAEKIADESSAEVETKYDELVRVRRTARGLERQRIIRRVEVWEWPDPESMEVYDDAQSTKTEAEQKDIDIVKNENAGEDIDIEVVID